MTDFVKKVEGVHQAKQTKTLAKKSKNVGKYNNFVRIPKVWVRRYIQIAHFSYLCPNLPHNII